MEPVESECGVSGLGSWQEDVHVLALCRVPRRLPNDACTSMPTPQSQNSMALAAYVYNSIQRRGNKDLGPKPPLWFAYLLSLGKPRNF